MPGPGVAVVGVVPGRSPIPAAMEIPIPAATPAMVAAIITAAGGAATTVVEGITVEGITMEGITAEGITAEGSVQEGSPPGTRLESIVPSTNLPGSVLYLGTFFRSLTLIYLRLP